MKMSKCLKTKAKIIILVLLIISLLSSPLIINAKDYSKCTNTVVSEELNPSYDYVMTNGSAKATLTLAKGELVIKKIDEGVYNEDTDNYTPDATVTHVSNPSQYVGKVVTTTTSKNPTILLTQAGEYDKATYIRVTLVLNKSTDNCDSAQEYENKTGQKITDASQTKAKEIAATAVLELFIPVPKEGNKIREENTNYATDYCKLMRAGSKDEAVAIATQINKNAKGNDEKVDINALNYFNPSDAYKEKYSKYLNQCFNQGEVFVNYTNAKLASLISSVIKSTDSLIKAQPPKSSALFDQGDTIAQIKDKAQKQQDGSMSTPASVENQHVYTFGKMPEKIDVTNPLKCEYRLKTHIKSIDELKTRDDKNQYRYTNNEYYYAISKERITKRYRYNYDYDDASKIQWRPKDICEKTCEEGVIVSYGPPQAVAAGFCFEYQIRVISKVKCNVELFDAAPTLEGYCTPVPQCEHVKIGTLTQAGPNSQFDACIAQCDGGKYTQSCSKSCYNKVYGKKGNINTALSYSGKVKQMADVNSCGSYVRTGGGIVWSNCEGQQTFARWHQEEDKKRYSDSYGTFEPDKDGFKRKEYKKGGECDGKCHNSGCDGDVYLNPGTAQDDYNYNMGQYEEGLRECSAGATCSTIVSNYKIKVDGYHEYNEAKLKSNEKFDNQVSDKENSILLGSNGCYNDNAHDYYAAEWSFPGTWVNNKTGEISFKPQNTGWHRVTNKFCLPLNAKATNSDWWNLYMKMAQGTITSEKGTGSYSSTEYNDKCTAISKASSNGVSDWNIKGETQNFGFFKWNIKISCFFATQSQNPTTDPPVCDPPTLNGYTTRTVDNQDLFPATDESKKTTTNPSEPGRTTGYNWTKAATITVENGKASPNYQIDPTVLIAKIQKLKDGVYNDNQVGNEQYLDYDITLSPEQINAIKKDIKAKVISYESWDNNRTKSNMYDKESKIILYESKFLRNSKYVTIVKNTKGLIGCNNQLNQSQCDYGLVGN